MGKRYEHVPIEEWCESARLQAEGRSIRQIAAGLDCSPSPVARELKRNGSRTGGCRPVYADQQVRARRWRGSRMERDDALRGRVLSRLDQGWSPEQVAGRLKLEAGRIVISHESIYRFMYGQLARTKGLGWRHYLPRSTTRPVPASCPFTPSSNKDHFRRMVWSVQFTDPEPLRSSLALGELAC